MGTTFGGHLEDVLAGFVIRDGESDGWVWGVDPSGTFSVKSAYTEITNNSIRTTDHFFRSLWSNLIPSKVAAFGCCVALGRLPTGDNLLRRGVLHGDLCWVSRSR